MTASLNKNVEYKEDKPNVQLILETEFTKEIRILFKKGQVMKEHTAPLPIVVEIFDGAIEFGVNNKVLNLEKGDLISLEGKVPHNLKATENSIVRLTLSKGDEAKRVDKVAEK